MSDEAEEERTLTTNTRDLYLDLLKKSLMGLLWDESKMFRPEDKDIERSFYRKWVYEAVTKRLARTGRQIMQPVSFDLEARLNGIDWPPFAHTMVGIKRLDNLQSCVEDVLRNNVPGDLIETGVWRGGSTIFMRGILKSYGVTDRRVWVADSFEGLPPPDPANYPSDKGDIHHTFDVLRVSLEEVQANFGRYGLLDEQVRFLKGWFRDTLPQAPIERLAVLRLDGDLYESTMDSLTNLYPKLQPGGYLIIDDYVLEPCREAVTDFRAAHKIEDEIIRIDGSGVFWQVSRLGNE
ncbi:MAG TPA: TylF/MycF family methyltransferase [Pyrinomonadaceae bacterium]|nr:TylF/MycF family methyltransferase [Pyrinomonadaceae bacterium]